MIIASLARRVSTHILALSLTVCGAAVAGAAEPLVVAGITLPAMSARDLVRQFDEINYRLADVRTGRVEVPRVFLERLPADLKELDSIALRKRLFIQALLPHVLDANERILARRARLEAVLEKKRGGARLGLEDRRWIARLADDCKLDRGASETFLRRLDVVPPALAIAQAAAESGWGTSRFAHKGNAVFGQRTWSRGKGLVPRRRDTDKRHEVKSFSDIGDSVHAYMMNLNCHPAYAKYRRARAEMRAVGAAFDSVKLARALTRYAEIGEAYVAILHRIIRVNRLHELDRATLVGIETGA